ncbi:MAG: hypothetical protein K8E66_03270 [Phycisphaerales bacterium]|nr:hypothetical protein [Phycisphaerales bacterium]
MERRRDRAEFHRRRCVGCGFGGDEIQREHGKFVFSCPACEADLYARPAMSYAEMEGLAMRPHRRPSWCVRVLRRAGIALVREPRPTRSEPVSQDSRLPTPRRRSSDVRG